MPLRSAFRERFYANDCTPIILSAISYPTRLNSILRKTPCIGIVIMFKSHPEPISPALRGIIFTVLLVITGLFSAWLFSFGAAGVASAQDQRTPIPLVTLVPPTLVPPPPAATATPPMTQSALAHIKTNNKLVVGFLYNIGRFSTLTDIGT